MNEAFATAPQALSINLRGTSLCCVVTHSLCVTVAFTAIGNLSTAPEHHHPTASPGIRDTQHWTVQCSKEESKPVWASAVLKGYWYPVLFDLACLLWRISRLLEFTNPQCLQCKMSSGSFAIQLQFTTYLPFVVKTNVFGANYITTQ